MKCSLAIANFLEEITNLFHSTVSLGFFALITEECFHISPCYSLELCIQMGVSLFFFLCFLFLFFSQLLLRPSQTAILLFCISFSWGWSWSLSPVSCTMLWTYIHSSSCILSIRSSHVNHQKRKRVSGKIIYFCFTDYAKAFDCVDNNKLWKILKQIGLNTRPPDLLLKKSVCRSGSNS